MKSYGKLTATLLVAWFLFALIAGALGLFSNAAARIAAGVGLAAGIPLVLFFLWIAFSPNFRQFILSLNPRILTYAQTWRLLGVVFVILEARGALPAIFALPAGYGDMFIGATAAFAAFTLATPNHRAAFITWQFLGILDLVSAVTLGITAPIINPGAVSMLPMTILPLSLIPTFLVPLFLILHAISIAQATRWPAKSAAVASPNTNQTHQPA